MKAAVRMKGMKCGDNDTEQQDVNEYGGVVIEHVCTHHPTIPSLFLKCIKTQ